MEAALEKALAFCKQHWPEKKPSRDELYGWMMMFHLSPEGLEVVTTPEGVQVVTFTKKA
jgi:hypothetical protein